MDCDSEWRPENEDIDANKSEEVNLQDLASQIGLRFCKPQPRRPHVRSRRKRIKPAQYVPMQKIRDFRGIKEQLAESRRKEAKLQRKQTEKPSSIMSYTGKRKSNTFGGVNAKKQRTIFGNKFTASVHSPLDVYKGMCC